jgi:hypothetical protein
MQVTRSSLETVAGPAEWFSGTVYFDTLATPWLVSRISAVNVRSTRAPASSSPIPTQRRCGGSGLRRSTYRPRCRD